MNKNRFSFIIAILTLLMVPSVSLATFSPDCDTNAITYCGASTKIELLQKITQGDGRHDSDDLQGIYNGRGMTTAAINSADTVDGIVTKDGNVLVGGKTVATGALTTGRQNIPGSTLNADTLYVRPPSVSFKQSQLDAWVYMPGGVFKWAIIKACGNPVTANAVPLVVGKGGGVTPTPTPPASVPKPIPVPPKTTPKTGGSESGLSLIGLMAIVLASWQYRRSRKELALAIRQN